MKRLAVCLMMVLALAIGHAASASSTGAQASGRTATVDINEFKFHPPTLRIAKGARVIFHNSSTVTHTATSPGAFDTHRIKPGRSAAVRFEHKGVFRYLCKIHPEMRGKIIVG